MCRVKTAALKRKNMFSGLYLAFVSTVYTIKQLPNLEQLDIIGTEGLEEIQRQNSSGHVAGALAEPRRKEAEWTRKDVDWQSYIGEKSAWLERILHVKYTSRAVEK